ncbi:MAG: MotA/TolQ/ExbB proton channel family protein [Oligoflexales bacterium]|nr:MotA/TolQ/ExbB proton channel family protein [Oligoflexales bacterium]
MWGELARSFQAGNTYVWVMATLFFIALMLFFERFIVLQFVYNLNFAKFLNSFKKMISSKDFERASALCKSASKTSLPKMALLAIEAKENDPTSVRGVLEESAVEFIPKIESRLHFFPTLATLTLLIGVLGTIDSMWWAFHSLNVLDTAKKQASLANGIASSLHSTAFGLIGGVFIISAHQILKGMALKLLDHVQHGVLILHNLLVPTEVYTQTFTSSPVAAVSPSSDKTRSEPASQTPQNEVQKNDAFDDSSVEDIKDEEEII